MFIYLSLYIALALLFNSSMRGTVFEFTVKNEYYGGFWIVLQVFLFVAGGVVFFGLNDLKSLHAIYVNEFTLHETSAVIFVSVVLLILSMAFFSKTIFKAKLNRSLKQLSDIDSDAFNELRLIRSVAIVLVVLITASHFMGVTHAFYKAIFMGQDLLTIRLKNRYESHGPTHIVGLVTYSFVLLSFLIGLIHNKKLNYYEKYLYIILVLYASTMYGNKGYVVKVFLLFYVGAAFRDDHSKQKILIIIPIVFVFITYYLASVQYQNITPLDFMEYIVNRVGAAQIHGVYEQFSLNIRDWEYIYNEIPFSGFFIDETKSFGKDLMMSTWSYNLQEYETGVMNSFFIGEAYAIGGYFMVFISCIVVAFNYCLIVYLHIKLLTKYFTLSLFKAQIISSLYLGGVLSFTGDLGGLLFGKRLFILSAFLLLLYMVRSVLPGLSLIIVAWRR